MYGESKLEEDEIEREEIDVDEIDEQETDGEDIDVKEFEEDDEFYEIIKHLLMTIQVVVHVLNKFMIVIYCLVRDTSGRSHITASINFNKVLKALNTIAPNMLTKPRSLPSKLKENTRFYPYFKDCIGGIDGTHIPAMIIGRDISNYWNRHRTISQNVLAAYNFDLEFMYVFSGWEGKYFLVNCGFPNRRQFLAPFRGVRYHLQEFGGQGRDPANEVELFNLRHASLRNVIERIFGIFKSRFTIFKSAPPFPFRTQTELVSACIGLHNFLRKECRFDEFPVEQDNEVDLELVDEVDPEPVFQTQEQQRNEANGWRHAIALNMWTDARHNDNNENQ
ncbi:hypothetical protein Ddye_017522 [Dipteronia dyeriana]|uniref:DDE Tnp4 domain-containing protein n=1 Tax=Dipteronia dyeriana TaxID=168575 RepID=A0AAD9U9J1_9ROSI|nr:hypothetical protein Ddye_017522 [Dipteronia dyeriana]